MITRLGRIIVWFLPWRRFCILLTLLFLSRGLLVLCVLPPFEGWDEYQHLAYVAYILEHGKNPTPGAECEVPPSMYPGLVKYPHSAFGVEQVGPIGGQSYEEYWKSGSTPPEVVSNAPAIALYQAQHGPLYYQMAIPLSRRLFSSDDPLQIISALRLVNLLLGAASVFLVLITLGQILIDSSARYLVGILVAIQPLFLLNSARVANDSLGVLLGTAAICWLLVSLRRLWWSAAVVSGVLIGLAILAKSVNMALVVFGFAAMITGARRRKMPWVVAAGGVALYLAVVLLVTLGYFSANLDRYGMLTPMQEAVKNRADGKSATDFIHAVTQIDWLRESWRMLSRKTLWVGGWSMLKPAPIFVAVYQTLIALILTGGWFALMKVRRRKHAIFSESAVANELLILVALFAVGLCYHGVHTKMAWGMVATNSWYAAVIFPWLTVLAVQCLRLLPGRHSAAVLGTAWALVCLATELSGSLLVMLPCYSASTSPSIIWNRTARMHPEWLSPDIGAVALAAVALLSLAAFAVWRNRCISIAPAPPIVTS